MQKEDYELVQQTSEAPHYIYNCEKQNCINKQKKSHKKGFSQQAAFLSFRHPSLRLLKRVVVFISCLETLMKRLCVNSPMTLSLAGPVILSPAAFSAEHWYRPWSDLRADLEEKKQNDTLKKFKQLPSNDR